MSKAAQVQPNQLIAVAAEKLKADKLVDAPAWVGMVKSGAHAERLPQDADFFYTRCASLLYTLYFRPTVGVRRLRNKYGGKRQHTVSRRHHTKASGKIIRVGLQLLEKAGLVKKLKVGREITAKGKSFLDKLAAPKQ